MRIGNSWLGRLDSNQGMAESKSAALPLGYAPTPRPKETDGAVIALRPAAGNACAAKFHRAEARQATRRVFQPEIRDRTAQGPAKSAIGQERACPPPLASLRDRLAPVFRACRSVAQSGSAPRSGRGGRRFKSCHSDQFSRFLLQADSASLRRQRLHPRVVNIPFHAAAQFLAGRQPPGRLFRADECAHARHILREAEGRLRHRAF